MLHDFKLNLTFCASRTDNCGMIRIIQQYMVVSPIPAVFCNNIWWFPLFRLYFAAKNKTAPKRELLSEDILPFSAVVEDARDDHMLFLYMIEYVIVFYQELSDPLRMKRFILF